MSTDPNVLSEALNAIVGEHVENAMGYVLVVLSHDHDTDEVVSTTAMGGPQENREAIAQLGLLFENVVDALMRSQGAEERWRS
jgi:hypothetical protein